MIQNKVDTLIASAGTGKTYRLVEEITAAITSGVPPHTLLATTFTKKAAAELAGRIRAELIRQGEAPLAAEMLAARVGTVNAVCGSLITDFAFELGRSPVADVIPEDRLTNIFARAVGPIIEAMSPSISQIGERFGLSAKGSTRGGRAFYGWQDDVRRIANLARSNGMGPERLSDCAARSISSLLAILPPNVPGETAEELDSKLAAAVTACHAELVSRKATLKLGTIKHDLHVIERACRALANGQLISWPDWASLTKIGSTKADYDYFLEVINAASAHQRHPRLTEDISKFITQIFDCAAQSLDAYADFKRERGLVDFVDQEMLALSIIEDSASQGRLRELIGAVFVDEFQDSSPIQIAIFAALSHLSPINVWVGDPKQSIYGFRDADPALTTAAALAIAQGTGGATDYLRKSYRTRPSLGQLVNAGFLPNFSRAGMTPAQVTFDAFARTEFDDVASLSLWGMAGKNKGVRTDVLAKRVAGLMANTEAWPVQDKDREARPARGSDIAILCRGNAQVADLALALTTHGVRVAVERAGLLDQPECELAIAALRWVADESDTLALAELARLTSDGDEWFAAAFETDQITAIARLVPLADPLAKVRDITAQLTPAETLDAVLHVPDLLVLLSRWGDIEQRLQNIEALRDLVAAYQEEQRSERQAATLPGAVLWLSERTDACRPGSHHPEAVNILTYHGAKGLEWPIVLLAELDAETRGSAFGVRAHDINPPDWNHPLASRTLRYWPWPYGDQKTGTGLDALAAASREGQAAIKAEREERVRLLYVGMTRARDHLGLCSIGGPQAWLNELQTDTGAPLFTFADDNVLIGPTNFAVRPAPDCVEPGVVRAPSLEYGLPSYPKAIFPAMRLTPSGLPLANPPIIRESVRLGDRIALTGDPDLRSLGEAFHRFLAADDVNQAQADRESLASAILQRWAIPQIEPRILVEVSDRLHSFLADRYATANRLTECPVHAPVTNEQLVSGRLDLLVDLGDGYAILDHKSFPGSIDMDDERLRAVAGQLGLYARALEAVSARSHFEYWIHQPIAGVMTRIELP